MFKLCILEAGYINPALIDKHPPYSDLFKDFLKYKTRNWNVSSCRLYKSEFPDNINDFDGFIIDTSIVPLNLFRIEFVVWLTVRIGLHWVIN